MTEYEYTITNLWTGKVYKVEDPIVALLVFVVWAWIIGWAPLWIPLHVILRIAGRRGFCSVDAKCVHIDLDLINGVKKVDS